MTPLRHLLSITLIYFAFSSQTLAACSPEQILRDDVLVVVNDNSKSSPQVGDYYCEQRGIDPANVAHVRVPVTNDVQLDQFISLRDQIIKHMQENTLPTGSIPVSCDTLKGYSLYYCPESIDQLRQNSKIRYIVMTKGLPIRFRFTGSTIPFNPEASIDNYLRFWLTNYFSADVNFEINNRAIAFGDGRGMRTVDPSSDHELIVGRIDGIDTESAKRLVDRVINAERNGIYGKLYGNKFGGSAFGGDSEGAFWKSWLADGSTEIVYPSPNYLHSLFGELQGLTGPAIRHTINSECLSYDATGKIPKECVTAINPGAIQDDFLIKDLAPGTPEGRIPAPDNALVHQGYLDTFSALEEFDHLLNWRDNESCNTLCADAVDFTTCKDASTDAYREIDTRCVRVADGYMGSTFGSYPVGMTASWPTGWFQSINFHPVKFDLTGSAHYYFWQPEVRNDNGADDNFSLWYSNRDESSSATCYGNNNSPEDYQTLPDGHCNLEKKISINQKIEISERSINLSNPQKIRIRFKYRGIGLNKNVPVSVRILVRESTYDDGVIKIVDTNQVRHSFVTLPNLIAPNDPADTSKWNDADVTITLDPALHRHPQYLYNGIRISINAAIPFEGQFAVDDFSVNEDGINLPLKNPSFNDGHRQLSGGDSAATFLSRLNGAAFWGNISHHGDNGHSFETHPYETLIYFLRGLPLGDSVWFAEQHNSGILYGDPLYSPIAIHLHYLSPIDNWAPDDLFSITDDSPLTLAGHTVNGSDTNVTTTYSVNYCSGEDFLVCDQNSNWLPMVGIENRQGGQRDMSLGNWDISSLAEGPYVLRLAVTSTNSASGLSQTFYDYYPLTLFTPLPDEDGDGLSYQEEIAFGTNPRNIDTDEDSLPDKWELDNGFDPLKSNVDTDSDGDGILDIIEVLRGTNPNNSQDVPLIMTHVVDQTSGIDDGQTPFKTLESAIDAVQAGDKISLLSGNYDTSTIYFTVPIQLEGPSDKSAIFQSIFYLWNRTITAIDISNLTFHGTNLIIGGDINDNRWNFKRNTFKTNTKIINNSLVEFTSNIFTNSSQNAINITEGSSAVLRSNTLTDNDVGIKADKGSSLLIINSIISGNISADLLGVPASSISYSLTGDPLLAGNNGNLYGNPLFVDPLSDDYHLMPESPAIDAGDPLSDFSKEPISTIGRINLGIYGNTDEAQIAAPSVSNSPKTNQSSGQIHWLLLLCLSLYGIWSRRLQSA